MIEEINLNNSVWALSRGINDLLETIEEDSETLKNTANRFCGAYAEILEGYTMDPQKFLEKDFEVTPSNDLVLVKNVPFYSLCKHHILPFFGTVSVGYLPDKKVIGLSKIPRLISCFSRRLQIQEVLGREICNAMMVSNLKPKGVITVIKARHLCMEMRGIQATGAVTTTASIEGVFIENSGLKNEAYNLMEG